jgi:hypothetical protein
MVPAMSSSTEATSWAADLHAAAERLHASVTSVDALELDLRAAVQLVGRALGELAAMSEELCRDFTRAGSPGASELVRRSHELSSSLCAARRNAELVCRHLPGASPSDPAGPAPAATRT